MYLVVHENIRGFAGQTFRYCTDFDSKEHFQEVFFEQGMQTEYRVIKEGASQEEVERLCATRTDNIKVLTNLLQVLSNRIRQVRGN